MPRYRGRPVRYRRRGVLRLRLHQLLDARGVSPYGLAKFTGLSLNTIYRLTRPNGRLRLIRADTTQALCGPPRATPGELFEYQQPSWRRPTEPRRHDAHGSTLPATCAP